MVNSRKTALKSAQYEKNIGKAPSSNSKKGKQKFAVG
eukprot:CAMPEP_0179308854 /NCGR_PEP_ID=MMETSP0797-20121207/51359_1 /TAXON_ID=47934 /ORGANISM="Dinophysis acuminata, Strain DAEP01" /LENGTH=36 /DNA_ID= /DNA_START= /DNA_END= /DNA_ORIENTATION=